MPLLDEKISETYNNHTHKKSMKFIETVRSGAIAVAADDNL